MSSNSNHNSSHSNSVSSATSTSNSNSNAENKSSSKTKPPPLPIIDPNIQAVVESCPFKAVTSGLMGIAFGFGIGTFFSSSIHPSMEEIEAQAGKSVWKQTVEGLKQAGKSGWSMGKSFGAAAVAFSASECVIESYRGKTDMWNTVSAGCVSGAALGWRGGPQAMGIGCVGFAAFSAAIDYFTGRHDSEHKIDHDDSIKIKA